MSSSISVSVSGKFDEVMCIHNLVSRVLSPFSLLNLVINTCPTESCFLHNCWSQVSRHSVAHGINGNFLFISAFGHCSVGSVRNLWLPLTLTVNRSGVARAVGHLRHMRCGQRIRCCNLAVLTLYTLGVH